MPTAFAAVASFHLFETELIFARSMKADCLLTPPLHTFIHNILSLSHTHPRCYFVFFQDVILLPACDRPAIFLTYVTKVSKAQVNSIMGYYHSYGVPIGRKFNLLKAFSNIDNNISFTI